MKIGIRAHDFGCLPPVRLAEKMAAQGVEAAQLAIPKAIAGVESYAQVTDGKISKDMDQLMERRNSRKEAETN